MSNPSGDSTITGLPVAATLQGTEVLVMDQVQGSSLVTVKATVNQIVSQGLGTLLSGTPGQMLVLQSGNTAAFSNIATLIGSTIDNSPIGATTPNTGAFTNLSASGTVTGTGFTNLFASPPPIGNTAANTGAFTTLSASSTVSGAGFTARFSSPGPIGNTSASTGAFTTITATGTITPSSTNGIVGTTTNDNANAGSVGELISSNVTSGSAVALTSSVTANITSISLPAGDWDVYGNVGIVTGGTTAVSTEQGAISTTSATIPTLGAGGAQYFLPLTLPTGQGMLLPVGNVRLSLSATTTVYLVANFTFTTSTCSAYGFIGARRRR